MATAAPSLNLRSQTLTSGPAKGSVIYTLPPGVHSLVHTYLQQHASDHPIIHPTGGTGGAGGSTAGGGKALTLAQLLGNYMTPQQMLKLATTSAQAAIKAQVAPYLVEEERAQARAAQQAADIRSASAAAAARLVPLAGQTDAVYADALNQLKGFGEGYSGQTRADAAAAAAAVQPNLDQLHAGQTAYDGGDALANVVYGLGADIPASPLAAARLAAYTSNAAFPSQLRGAGEQQAYGAINAGNTRVQDLIDQSMQVRGQLPQLIQQYLTSFSTQQQNQVDTALKLAQLNKVNTQIKSLGNGQFAIVSADPVTGKYSYQVVGQPLTAAKTTVTSTGRGGFVTTTTRPDGSVVQTTVPGTPYPGKSWTDKQGVFHMIGPDGKTVISYGTPYTPPVKPIVRGTPASGYDIFDGATGAKIGHYPGGAGTSKPIIRGSPSGGYDIFDGTTGKKIGHYKGTGPVASASDVRQLNQSALHAAQGFANQYKPGVIHKNAQGKITYTTPPVASSAMKDAFGQVLNLGNQNDPAWRKKAYGFVWRAYQRFVPLITSAATQYATHNYDDKGNITGPGSHTEAETTQAMIDSGFPPDLATAVVHTLYVQSLLKV